ncbi:hypothetical protein GGH92_010697, partial [Coemansia sp. RSA 2673]
MLDRRLTEDRGETIFKIGQEDNGAPMDLADDDVAQITATIDKVVQMPQVSSFAQLLLDSGGALVANQGEKLYARDFAEPTATAVPPKRANQEVPIAAPEKAQAPSLAAGGRQDRSLHFLIRRKPASVEEMLEVRVAVVGNVDAGKSTMLGVLTQGRLDDGRGKARVALFRHQHEIESGRTSRSSKLISFLDLAGHEKYLKTTVFGMAGGAPEYVMLMVAANAGLCGMSKEHLGLALALGIPVFVVITKIDMCPPNILDTPLRQLTK